MKWIPLDAIPGVVILPHWQAKYYTPDGMISYDAAVWHMAEGAGTDSWLLHPSGNNSSHLVVKSNGNIRQIVSLEDAAHSLHIARPDGPPGPGDDKLFSLDAVQRVLATGWRDPNTQIIAIEIEGFAAAGPNDAQKPTIVALARYLERLYPSLRHLGHRDFQNYKACPGRHIFNEILPHEGRLTTATGDIDVPYINFAGKFTTNGPARSFSATDPYREIAAIDGTFTVTGLRRIDATTTPHGLFVEIATGTIGRRLIPFASGRLFTPDLPPVADTAGALEAAQAEIARLRALLDTETTEGKEIAAQLTQIAARLAA